MEKSIKKRLKYLDNLFDRCDDIDHESSRKGLKQSIKKDRDNVADEIGKKYN